MTSAERPTQEVAPRTEAGDELEFYVRGILIAVHPDRHPKIIESLREYIGKIEAEASRSAPPAAVTVEQLAEALPSGWTAITTKEQRQRFAQLILSKITPAQPSASSERDGGWFNPITGDGYAPDQPLPSGDPYLREIETRLTNALNADPFESDPLWRLRDDLRKRLAAKPTGSADEPLLRAALDSDDFRDLHERAFRDHLLDPKEGWPHTRAVLGVQRSEQREGCDDLCSDAILDRARAALASAEPAEVDGDE